MTMTLDRPNSEAQNEDFTPPSAAESEPLNNVMDIRTKSILAEDPVIGNTIQHERWRGTVIPYPFLVTDAGLVKTSEEKPGGDLIANPIVVVADTEGPDGNDGGLVLEIQNRHSRIFTTSIPRARLHEDAKLLAADLATQNVFILPGKEKDLLVYLAKCMPAEKRIAMTQTGWATTQDPDELVYVLPEASTKSGYHFQPDRFGSSTHAVRSSGALTDWTMNVFDPSAYPLFAVMAALSATLIKHAGTDSGGFHFYGGSSSGKTTLAQIAASVWGNGADPSDAPTNPYIKRWNATLNAMEGLAAAHNDLPLILDELGSCNARDVGRGIYDLAGGQGKSSMDQSRQMRKQRTWRNMLMSTGEISSQAKIEENLQAQRLASSAKAGQMIRLIDVEVTSDIFRSGAMVDDIKRSCARYYGTLGPAFVNKLVETFNRSQLNATTLGAMDRALARLIEGRDTLSAVQKRALRRFALVEVAGHLLVYFKLIPTLTSEMVTSAVQLVVDNWLPSSNLLNDSERAVINLREFILANTDTRIKDLKNDGSTGDKLNREIAGYYDPHKDIYYLLPAAFHEATKGNTKIALEELYKKRLLRVEKADRRTSRVTVNGKRINAYAISARLIEGDHVSETDDGQQSIVFEAEGSEND